MQHCAKCDSQCHGGILSVLFILVDIVTRGIMLGGILTRGIMPRGIMSGIPYKISCKKI